MEKLPYNHKMIIAYDGTAYSGWQIQENAISIQSILEDTIKIIIRREVRVIGSGRTDAGVHALGQVAHFHTSIPLNYFRFLRSLNGLLPKDIRVKSIEEAPTDFHAQHKAVGKIYHYRFTLDKVQNPFDRLYQLHVHEQIDLNLLKEAADFIIGTHDFTSFANEAHMGSASKDPVRTLKRIDLVQEASGWRLEFEADGFLYKMVRNITGILFEVGAGKRKPVDIPLILQAKDRKAAGKAVFPHGLFLIEVQY
jgi:tRNA pseudouridine38-40 synthase